MKNEGVPLIFMKMTLFILLLFGSVSIACASNIDYIRAFDLGGGGLKTALFAFDKETEEMKWLEPQVQLGSCPDDREVCRWIRESMQVILKRDLDREIKEGYLFGFSLAGLDKLRRNASLETADISVLFAIPPDKVFCIDDGSSHLMASLQLLDSKLPKGPIWNFSIGTGVGIGFTDHNHQIQHRSKLRSFFGVYPWDVKVPGYEGGVWKICSSKMGFDNIVNENGGRVDNRAFMEFAFRWKIYLKFCLLEKRSHPSVSFQSMIPAGIVFTGGHVDRYGKRLEETLKSIDLDLPIFTGPKHAGLLGAAWTAAKRLNKDVPLITAILNQDDEKIKSILASGADVNAADALDRTPLSVAIEKRRVDFVKELIAKGANTNISNFVCETPLFLAVKSNQPEIVALLLDHGADLNHRNCWGQTVCSFGFTQLSKISRKN